MKRIICDYVLPLLAFSIVPAIFGGFAWALTMDWKFTAFAVILSIVMELVCAWWESTHEEEETESTWCEVYDD